MKGIIFTELLSMVDDVFSPHVTEEIIDAAELPSGGAYTAVGNYPHTELLSLVVALSKSVDTPAMALVEAFGVHLFGRFAVLYPDYFKGRQDAFSFLEAVEDKIHTEVRKLHSDAKPPRIACLRLDATKLKVDYSSHRCLSAACFGLLQGCVRHFGEDICVTQEEVRDGGQSVTFLLECAV